ncbi:MAG: hypothetical protein ABSD20_22145 [Terriglobales bacterium]
MRIRFVVTILLVFSAISVFAQTNAAATSTTVAVPTLVHYSSALPMTNATVGVTFALYKDQTGGAPLWLETQNVSLDGNGRYTVNLGANHAGGIPAELFAAGEARWLGVQPEGQPEQPRVLLVSVPYAMKAADADTLGGLPASSYVTADQLNDFGAAQPVLPTSGPQSARARYGAPDTSDVTPSPCSAVTSDGTAVANYITRFTAPPLDLEPAAQTATSGSIFAEHMIMTVNPTANSAASMAAFSAQANTSTGNAFKIPGEPLWHGDDGLHVRQQLRGAEPCRGHGGQRRRILLCNQ